MPILLPLRPAVYRHPDGRIVRITLDRKRMRLEAQVWKRGTDWEGNLEPDYRFHDASDLIPELRPHDRMPLDEARRISKEIGQCLACGRRLTDKKSQEAGIGPTCAKLWSLAQVLDGIVFDASPADVAAAEEEAKRAALAARRACVRARLVGGRVEISSRYDDLVVSIIKTFENAIWDHRSRVWSVPQQDALPLAQAFAAAGIAHDDLAAIGMGWTAA